MKWAECYVIISHRLHIMLKYLLAYALLQLREPRVYCIILIIYRVHAIFCRGFCVLCL